jgi:hypothetical protein
LTIKASQRVLDFFRAEASVRLFDKGPDPAPFAVALEAQGVTPHDAFWAFEERFGGWRGWTTLGVRASERFSGRLPGHVLIGHRGRNDFFMAPDGAVVTVEDEKAITVAGNAEAWLEQLALRHAIEVRQNAMDLGLRGAKTAALAQALGAKRDAAASDRIDCWVLPKGQGLLVGPYGDDTATLAVVPSVRAAARVLSLKGQVDAVSISPIRPRDELLPAEDAPLRAEVLARVSFAPPPPRRLRARGRALAAGRGVCARAVVPTDRRPRPRALAPRRRQRAPHLLSWRPAFEAARDPVGRRAGVRCGTKLRQRRRAEGPAVCASLPRISGGAGF